jgi:hypothetical protein
LSSRSFSSSAAAWIVLSRADSPAFLYQVTEYDPAKVVEEQEDARKLEHAP